MACAAVDRRLARHHASDGPSSRSTRVSERPASATDPIAAHRDCETCLVSATEGVSAWDPPKGAMWFPMAIYGGIVTLVVVALPLPGWWTAAALVAGWVAVALVGSRLYAAVEYTLTGDSLTRRRRGKEETIPLKSITSVYGYYEPRVGDFLSIQSRTDGFNLQLGGEVDELLKSLGPRLVELRRDREVIKDEKARRWLGLPGGGLRDPWKAPPGQGPGTGSET